MNRLETSARAAWRRGSTLAALVAALAAASPLRGATSSATPASRLVSSFHSDDSAAVPFVRVYQSTTSAYAEASERVVRSDAEWRRAWLAAHPNRAAGPPPAPAVDFARDLVVVVTAGAQRTGGVSVGVDSVRRRPDGGADVLYTVASPGPGCLSTQQLTAPVDVVRFARRPGDGHFIDVHFVRRERATAC